MKKNFTLYLSLLIVVACNQPDSVIKKDLSTRFTRFEVVEIRSDSANINEVSLLLMSLPLEIAQGNANMAKAENKYFDKIWTYKQTTHYMDSVSKELSSDCVKFTKLQFSKADPCFYVKYRIFKDELKIEKEEYYYLRKYGDKNETEVWHRPVSWKEYMKEAGHPDLIGESMEYYLGFLRSMIYG